ncbi:MICOS complex subunit MIC27 [Tiliqua scincoides]|uniref:MICOS complex subunit MIC27 n=1 Tax=Tiliqua scincoides TaxID=71010 RepID=UPI00346372D5
MAAKIAKWAALPTTLACASMNVYAATEDNPKSHQIKAHQLSIYNAPSQKSRYVDEKPGRLQTGISSIRGTAAYYLNGCKGAYLSIKNGIISSVQFGKDAYIYLKNPPPEFLPKVGAITISGLTGVVLARKGSRFKKIAYPLGLGTLGVCFCYPVQSVFVAKVTGKKVYAVSHKTYEAIGSLWTKKSTAEVPLTQNKATKKVSVPDSSIDHSITEAHMIAKESKEKVKASELQFHPENAVTQMESMPSVAELKVPSVITDALKASKFKPDPSLMDHGQSSPEDADMYSTRS